MNEDQRVIPESNKVRDRNQKVLNAAVELAEEKGFQNVLRRDVAERAGVGVGSVNNAFETMANLRDAVMDAAVKRGIAIIVGQGLAAGHPAAKDAPPALRQQAGAAIAA